eukprot:6490569-Amphidinium_carterae.1
MGTSGVRCARTRSLLGHAPGPLGPCSSDNGCHEDENGWVNRYRVALSSAPNAASQLRFATAKEAQPPTPSFNPSLERVLSNDGKCLEKL